MKSRQICRVVECFRPQPDCQEPSFPFLSDCLGNHDHHLQQIAPDTTVDRSEARNGTLRDRSVAAA